ncbi:uncharacterized protein LOC135145820 [Zophobas morio]|uniref:uncharacterized protein LOC135145820 n=1 Tax=Zophobas morio TaxID=2755281 RepID=UPI0030831952
MEFSGEYDEKEVVVSTPPFDLKTDDVIRTEFRLPKNIDSEEDYKPTDWKEIILSVAKSTCQYNDRLTKERTLLRGAVYNSQLQQMHFQQSKVLATKPLRKTSKFPVACIESQFTDLPARRYDSKELAELCETPPEIYRRG